MNKIRLIAASLAMALMAVVAPSPSVAEPIGSSSEFEVVDDLDLSQLRGELAGFGTACEEMTDSILRLYTAYFVRLPDQGGFDYWVDLYQNATSLPTISEFFAGSPEFIERYGSLTDEQFVNLVYINVLDRLPDQEGFNFWVSLLRGGTSRGIIMLSFSESEEYVNRLGLQKPLSGYLTWYPDGMYWYCGAGNQTLPINTEFRYMDYSIKNYSQVRLGFVLEGLDASGNRIFFDDDRTHDVEPGFLNFWWGNDASGFRTIKMTANPSQTHLIVLYNKPMPNLRVGWDE